VALQHLIEEIKNAGDDLSLKSIVICGSGPVFSAGHNLKELVSYNISLLLSWYQFSFFCLLRSFTAFFTAI